MKPNVEELKTEYSELINKVLAHRFDFQPSKQRLLQYSGQKGPFWAVLEVWASAGNSGLSPFALAGISGISPRRVLARVRRNPKCSITLSFCTTSLLPILSASWTPAHHPFRSYFPERQDDWLQDEYGDDEADPNFDKYSLEGLLALYGRPGSWRKFCTKDFNPHDASVAPIEQELWDSLKRVYQLASQLEKAEGGE